MVSCLLAAFAPAMIGIIPEKREGKARDPLGISRPEFVLLQSIVGGTETGRKNHPVKCIRLDVGSHVAVKLDQDPPKCTPPLRR